jgi:hypothetical protein
MRLTAALSALVLLSPVPVAAQTDPVLDSRRAYQAAIRAYEASVANWSVSRTAWRRTAWSG